MPPIGPVSAPIFIGREQELAAVHAFLRAHVDAGTGGALLVSGEAGIGKSRLAREAAARATALGFRVLHGTCFDRDQTLPYAPFLDLLRGYAASGPDEIGSRHLSDAQGSPPVLGMAATVANDSSNPELEQRRVFRDMETLLAGLADERPLLVVIEDIHWSDETSLDLLQHLIRRAARLALLITFRGDEPSPALSRFLSEIDRRRAASEIALLPMALTEVAQQVRAILGLPRAAGLIFVRALHNLTGGNPYFVEEVLRSLIAEGQVYLSDEGWQRKPLDQLRVPRSVNDAVGRRTALLGPAARELLTLAAVIGHQVDFALLQTLSGLADYALLSALKDLIAAQLLVETSADAFTFRHALTRQAVSNSLLARERRTLHARVAHAIECGAGGGGNAALADLAYHCFEAGEWERAQTMSRAAGDRARARYAPRAAAEHYTRAIEAAARRDVSPDAEVMYARGQAYDALGDFDAARTDYETALATAEARGDLQTAVSALLALGLLWSGRDYEQARRWLLRAIDRARARDDPATLAHALNRLGNWHANHEDIDEALRGHHEALAIFERLGDLHGVARTLDLLAMAETLGGNIVAAREAALRAADLFAELDDRQGLAGVLPLTAIPTAVFEIATLAGGSTIASGVTTSERALALAREIEWRSGESLILALLGEALAVQGEFGRSLSVLGESVAIAEEIDHRQWAVQARWGLARLYGTMLLPAREREELERILALAREIRSPNWINLAAAGLASALIGLGDLDAAESLLAQTALDKTPMRTQAQRVLWASRAELALARGQPREALSVIDRLYSTAVNLSVEGEIPFLAQIKAGALVALGDLAPAAALLREAQGAARDQGALPALRSLHLALASLLRAQDRTEEAASEEASAREIAKRLAATLPAGPLHDELLQAAGLAPDDEARPEDRPSRSPGGLTGRERQVAMHITAGHSNREIANDLFVSERTVEAHVTNILRKLAVPSRAGIAAWVGRQGSAEPGT